MPSPFVINSNKFRRCFYEMSKELFNVETKPTTIGPRQYMDIIAFFCSLRILLVTYVMYFDYEVDDLWWYDFRHHDILVSFLHTFRSTLDYNTFLMLYFFDMMYFFLTYWCFRLDVKGRNWHFWYQMTVVSLDQYYECRLSGSQLQQIQALKRGKYEEQLGRLPLLSGRLVSSISEVLASVEVRARMEDVDVQAIKARPLPAMPFLSWKIRARALRVMLITDAFAYVFQVGIIIVYFISMGAFIYIYPHWDRHAWYNVAHVVFEMSFPPIFILLLIRYIFLFATLIILGTIVFTSHVTEWQNKVEEWLKQFRIAKIRRHTKLALPIRGRVLLERFLREHNLVCYLVISCGGQLFGKIILATVCTQIPVNVVFVRKIFVSGSDETLVSVKLLFLLVCSIQLSIFAVIFVPLGWCQTVYHSSKKFIPQFLLLSTGSGAWWWTLRLKYNDLYGRLMSGPKFALSVGELRVITYLSSIEFLSSYIAYLLMAFSAK